MNFNKHGRLKNEHAFLGASKYSWVNYTPEKLAYAYRKHLAVAYGTAQHALAEMLIKLGQNLPRSKKTLNMYVNDAIGYKMTPEQLLYYSDNCFGTADAISFRDNTLRIHDLKTGETPAHMQQLEIYAALFCLEYRKKPDKIKIELRIYQMNEVDVCEPAPEAIQEIMDKIVSFDKIIEQLKTEGEPYGE